MTLIQALKKKKKLSILRMYFLTMLSEERATNNRKEMFWRSNAEQKPVSITSLKKLPALVATGTRGGITDDTH